MVPDDDEANDEVDDDDDEVEDADDDDDDDEDEADVGCGRGSDNDISATAPSDDVCTPHSESRSQLVVPPTAPISMTSL